MLLPKTDRRRALIVIDLQPAFIKPHNQHIVPNIVELIKKVPYDAYIEAVFHAEKDSLWDTQQGFTVPQDDTMRTVDEVAAVLRSHKPLRVVKTTRSTFKGNQDLEVYLKERGIEEVHLVGTETHDCVLATAYDAFAAGYPVYALEECCESGTPTRHEAGLKLLRWQNMTNNSCRAETVVADANIPTQAMQPTAYTFNDARTIDLGTKTIYKYPTPTKLFDIGRMVVRGRHPERVGNFINERECSFIMYITKGSGRVFAGGRTFNVKPEDVLFVPAKNNFAVEGDFEYITFDAPAFYPEQSEEVAA